MAMDGSTGRNGVALQVMIPASYKRHLKKLAVDEGRSVAWLVRTAITKAYPPPKRKRAK